jgi:protoporphyrinogen oxidase
LLPLPCPADHPLDQTAVLLFKRIQLRERVPDAELLGVPGEDAGHERVDRVVQEFVPQPALASRSDDELADLVVSELRDLMGVAGSPVFTRVAKWERAIPQYTMGYQTVVNAIEALERDRPGLFVCSNYRGGIAVGDCVMSGERIAKRLTEYFGRAGRA